MPTYAHPPPLLGVGGVATQRNSSNVSDSWDVKHACMQPVYVHSLCIDQIQRSQTESCAQTDAAEGLSDTFDK